jgi:hypothetical protein
MIDWRKLQPGRVLEPGSPDYAWRPESWNGAPRLVALLNAGMGPLVITGPPGSGKSTELAAAVAELRKTGLPLFVRLEQHLDLRQASRDQVLVALVRAIIVQLAERKFQPSAALKSSLQQVANTSLGARAEAAEVLLRLIRELRVRSRQRLTLIIDGFDQCEALLARSLAEAVRPLASAVALAVVVAPSAVTGPEARQTLDTYRLIPVGPAPLVLELPGTAAVEAWKFLSAIATQRLGLQAWPENIDRYAYKAALCSGGLARSFLQFLQDAAAFSLMAQHRRIMRGDMRLTYRQNHERAMRLLRDGDLPALERCKNTNGVDLPLDTRRRLLDLGLLLEFDSDGKTIALPHPILTEYTISPIVDGAVL